MDIFQNPHQRVTVFIDKLKATNDALQRLSVEAAEVLLVQAECLSACLRGHLIIEKHQEEAGPCSTTGRNP